MTLKLDLSPDLETKLRQRAAAAGKDPAAFALEALYQIHLNHAPSFLTELRVAGRTPDLPLS